MAELPRSNPRADEYSAARARKALHSPPFRLWLIYPALHPARLVWPADCAPSALPPTISLLHGGSSALEHLGSPGPGASAALGDLCSSLADLSLQSRAGGAALQPAAAGGQLPSLPSQPGSPAWAPSGLGGTATPLLGLGLPQQLAALQQQKQAAAAAETLAPLVNLQNLQQLLGLQQGLSQEVSELLALKQQLQKSLPHTPRGTGPIANPLFKVGGAGRGAAAPCMAAGVCATSRAPGPRPNKLRAPRRRLSCAAPGRRRATAAMASSASLRTAARSCARCSATPRCGGRWAWQGPTAARAASRRRPCACLPSRAWGEDLTPPPPPHPCLQYKTELCRTFATSGTCPYGTRCRWVRLCSCRTLCALSPAGQGRPASPGPPPPLRAGSFTTPPA